VVSKLAEAGKRAGKSLSPVGKRLAQPFHWHSAGPDSQLAGDQIVQQPSNKIQVPESMEAQPTQVASRPEAKFRISDATPQVPEAAPAAPADLSPAVSVPITTNTGEFHSIQQPNMEDTEPVVISPTPSASLRESNSYSIRDPEPTMSPSSPQRGPEPTLAQPAELVPTFEAPADEPNRQKPATLPRVNAVPRSIQQPDAVLSSSAPARPSNTASHAVRQAPAGNAAPARLRLPDMVLPAKPQEADADPGQRPRLTQSVRITDRVASEGHYRISDSVLPAAGSTATRTLWQPDAVR